MDILINAKLVQTHQLGSYRYFVSSVLPHKSASLVILLLDTSRNEVSRIHKVIEGDEYAGWGADDSYLDEVVDREVRLSIGEQELVWSSDETSVEPEKKKRGRPKKVPEPEPVPEPELPESEISV